MRETAFDLARFKAAQDPVFETALAELGDGQKRSHWMWFVFPQLRRLGRSPTALPYGIVSIDEARAYLADHILADRLRLATEAANGVHGRSAHEIFGSPDDLKFRSSMTLFGMANGSPDSIFQQALDRYFDGEPDEHTLALLRSGT
ncbi:MAG TPA: DUF1810 domain-containing protein [Devosia sp.]|nr:DUF1810 domain-containing protein [Devosia sp.]